MTDQQTQYLTVRQTAAILRVSDSTIYRACKKGNLPFRRLGERGHLRIDAACVRSLRDFIVAPDDEKEK